MSDSSACRAGAGRVATQVRVAQADDQAALSELYRGYLEFYRQPGDTARVSAYVAELLADARVVLLVAGTPALGGFLTAFRLRNSLTQAGLWYVSDLYTAPDCRGQGLASALLAELARAARAAGVDRCELSTALDNEVAQRLYLRHGWQPDTVFRYFTLSP